MGGMAAAALGAIDLPIDIGGGGADIERIAAIFRSTTVTDAAISKFNLMTRYRQRYLEDTRKALQLHCLATIDKKPAIVKVTCEDTSPQFATDLVTFYAKYGNEVARRISASSAAEERKFLETRVAQARNELDQASQNLRDFQERNKIISLPEQAKAVVASMATLRAEMLQKQTQLAYVDSFSSNDESTSGQLRAQVGVLRSRLKAMEESNGVRTPTSAKSTQPASSASADVINAEGVFPLATSIPPLQYQLERLLREQKTQEILLTLLVQRYETARVNVARDTSTFQVLDYPVVPTQKSRPKVSMCAAIGLLVGLLFGFGLTVVRQLRKTAKTKTNPVSA
jgi:capsule polysaccharide export protein KpsE/RkpR